MESISYSSHAVARRGGMKGCVWACGFIRQKRQSLLLSLTIRDSLQSMLSMMIRDEAGDVVKARTLGCPASRHSGGQGVVPIALTGNTLQGRLTQKWASH